MRERADPPSCSKMSRIRRMIEYEVKDPSERARVQVGFRI